MLRIVLIKVPLQVIVAQSIAFLMLSIAFTFDLQTLICQVYISVLGFEIILGRTCSQITMLVEVNSKIVGNDSPHTHIKFASIKQKWMFHILLDHPGLGLWILLEDELIYVS